MLLVLAHGADVSAAWAAERLRARHGREVELVLVEWLDTPQTTWRHELGADGPRVEIAVGGAWRLRTGDASAVLNRVLQPPARAAAGAVPGDAEYAEMELSAFAASWLLALAPVVVNAPTPQGFAGRWRPPLHWRVLAQRAGFSVAPLDLDSDDPPPEPAGLAAPDGDPATVVLAIGGEPLGRRFPARVREATRRLAARADTPILGLRFEGANPARAGWRLLDATPYPDLSLAGDAGVEALDAVLAA